MNTRTVSWRHWVSAHPVLVQLLFHSIVLVAASLIIAARWAAASPTMTSMTTVDPLPYLPAKYEFVERVTNVLEKNALLATSAGVGAPQIERSIESYKANERVTTHYLTVSAPWLSVTRLDYYDFQVEKVVHTKYQYDSPYYANFPVSGNYVPVSWQASGSNLVVDRVFKGDNNPLAAVIIVVVAFLYFCVAFIILAITTTRQTTRHW